MEEILKDVGNRYPTNKSQVYGLLLLSLITDSFGFLFFFLSPHTPKKKTILLHCFAIKGPMFNGDCLSLNNDNGNAFLSHYVMLCHASDTTLPLFDTSVTVANMNFPRSDYISSRPEGWRLCIQCCFGFVCGPVTGLSDPLVPLNMRTL